jgi:riboflavin biosynthesis pyrimidine reductase
MHDEFHQENIIFSDGNLKENLQSLVRDHHIHFVMLEAGGVLAQAMMELQFIDEVALFLTPWLCGGAQAPLQGSFLPHALPVKIESSEHLHPDFFLRGTL